MQTVTTIGLDIAKSVFQVHGVDAGGNVVIRDPKRTSIASQPANRAISRVCSAFVEPFFKPTEGHSHRTLD
jgi:hypothetical protein